MTWLQEKTKPVFVAATANNIQSLPPELLRRGRLDEIFFVDLPTAAERESILAIHLKKKKRDPAAFDTASVVAATAGFSGAEIEQAVVAALHEAFAARREVTSEDLNQSAADLVPLSRTMSEEIEALRTWAAQRTRPAARARG